MAEKIINILGYTNNWNYLNYLTKGQLSFETEDEAIDYFDDIRVKSKSMEIWSYPYVEECNSIMRIVVRHGGWCEIDRID